MYEGIFGNAGNIDLINMLRTAVFRIVPLLLCLTIHELAHGFTAYKLGDDTAKKMGRLTLNPIKHIDPVGALMMLIIGFGWAKPVPVDMRNFKHPKRHMAITALAGPVSNILLAVILMFIFGFLTYAFNGFFLSPAGDIVFAIFIDTVFISILLAVFNMLPIPPLDGSKVLFAMLPDETYFKLMQVERLGFLVIIGAIALHRFFGIDLLFGPIVAVTSSIFSYMLPIFHFASGLFS